MFGALKEKNKDLLGSVKSKVQQGKSEGIEKAKDFLKENKEQIRSKAQQSDIAQYLIDRAAMMMSLSVVASFVYGCLPAPIQWVVSEELFTNFVVENTEFIGDLLIEA